MPNNETIRAKQIVKDLHEYCFCSQPTWRRMLYNFSQGDFILLNDLIDKCDRQESELEKYQQIEQTVKGFWSELKKMSAFKDLQEPTLTELLEYIEQTNAEAIKEFEDKVIKRICERVVAPTPEQSHIVERCNEEIHNLVKEEVGGSDE